MKPTLVVLAGGMGSRYGSLKQLEGVGPNNETIIDYSVFDAIRAGFKKVVFIVRESTADDFKAQVASKIAELDIGHNRVGTYSVVGGKVEVEVVYQQVEPSIPGIGVVARSKPWGTGHAVLVAREVVNDVFAVINADDYYGVDSFKVMLECLTERVSPVDYSVVGFELGKTLSSNGSVSRAICDVDDTRRLESIVERTQIIAEEHRIVDHSMGHQVVLSARDPVSMNFWGFHPSFFSALEESFTRFATEHQTDPKAEFYIPLVIEELLRAGSVAVEVLESREQWYGLTYAEDRVGMQQALARMAKEGVYPSPLWQS